MGQCDFDISWVGQCKKDSGEKNFCDEHRLLTCSSCGAQAIQTCEETGQFVCGAPLCDECEHTLAEDGTNGGIGFYRTLPHPEGAKEHCKKSEQVYKPWYEQQGQE